MIRISSISFGAVTYLKSIRERIVSALVENKIETRLFSAGNLGLHPFWEEYNGNKQYFKVADQIHNCGFFLPNYPELTISDVDFISNVVLEAAK